MTTLTPLQLLPSWSHSPLVPWIIKQSVLHPLFPSRSLASKEPEGSSKLKYDHDHVIYLLRALQWLPICPSHFLPCFLSPSHFLQQLRPPGCCLNTELGRRSSQDLVIVPSELFFFPPHPPILSWLNASLPSGLPHASPVVLASP